MCKSSNIGSDWGFSLLYWLGFVVIILDRGYDAIFGMSWFEYYNSVVIWKTRELTLVLSGRRVVIRGGYSVGFSRVV